MTVADLPNLPRPGTGLGLALAVFVIAYAS